MKIFISGVAGFIGSNLASAHLLAGDEVVGLDNLCTGQKRNLEGLDGLKFIEANLMDARDLLPDYVDVVYHFASPASPEKYIAQPVNTMDVNTLGTRMLLEHSLEVGARFVFASTSEVYGDPLESPQREEYWGNVNPIGPRSVYDEAKRFGETLVAHFQREHKANAGIIRIFNTYGPNMDPYDGRVVSTFLRQALLGEPLTIFGTGLQTRSFCFIDDLVNGIRKMGETDHPGPINLGNPEERTLLDLASQVLDITNSSSAISHMELPRDDPKQRKPDISRAQKVLGWVPTVGIRAGLESTALWIKKQI